LEAVAPGADIDLGCWKVTEELVRRYLDTTGDLNQDYYQCGLAPPLALAAWALGALLAKLDLPPGAIHSLQEVDTVQATKLGEEIRCTARWERPRRRGDLEFVAASYVLKNSQGEKVQTGKSTVLVAGAEKS
jgi:acyl dehydratase